MRLLRKRPVPEAACTYVAPEMAISLRRMNQTNRAPVHLDTRGREASIDLLDWQCRLLCVE